ncbi:hypothetical protein [Microcella alkaliphila]|uniref:hypothetical protein n=1 Tax=Microcella alkaliphila TaxID=279828 RepID=UPI000BBA9F9C|nr:hypothetical protein [Microcella alkaliphila]
MAVEEISTSVDAPPASRRLSTVPAAVLYLLGATVLAFALAAAVAVVRLTPGLIFSPGYLGMSDVSEAITRLVAGTAWLLPITLVGAVVGGIVSRTEDLKPQTGMIAVTVGGAVGALSATQLMPPPGVASHDLAAWAVLAPALALLLAILPWPGALVHPDGGTADDADDE